MEIVIPFANIESINPNLNINYSDSKTFYYKNIAIAFASIRRWNQDLSLRFVTNYKPPKYLETILERLSVSVDIIEFNHKPPDYYGKRFLGCFYLFDAIYSMKESTLFLDPDVLCTGEFVTLLGKIGDSFAGLDLKFPKDKDVNGLTPISARKLFSTMTNRIISTPIKHVGGEAIFIPFAKKELFLEIFSTYWNRAQIAKDNDLFLPTEEHIVSSIFAEYGFHDLNSIVLRIWTTLRYNKIEGGTFSPQIPLWHLPSEKNKGFVKLFNAYDQDLSYLENFSEADFKYDNLNIFGIEFNFLKRLLRLSRFRIEAILRK
jgi:hypothetical protein